MSDAPASHPVSQLLKEARPGDPHLFERLMPLVYRELQRLAHHHLRDERDGHTLTTTALVHEAYLKLVDQSVSWQNRGHFFAVASMAMRRILINYARDRDRLKRGGGAARLSLDEAPTLLAEARSEELLALDEALSRLASINERAARVVECRFFGGLTIEETAAVLRLSPTTVKHDWRLAKTWLHAQTRP